jgi:hypothetical protein
MNRRFVNLEALSLRFFNVETVDHLIGLFTIYRNIKKLAIYSYLMHVTGWSRSLRTILPIFSELEELRIYEHHLGRRGYEDMNEMFDVISNSCPNLRKLGVPRIFKGDAENYFRISNLIIIG